MLGEEISQLKVTGLDRRLTVDSKGGRGGVNFFVGGVIVIAAGFEVSFFMIEIYA